MDNEKMGSLPWTNKYKSNWNDSFKRIMAWWEGTSIDRPVIISFVRKPDTLPFNPQDFPETHEERDLNEEYNFLKNQHFLESNLFLAESVPGLRTSYAASIGMLGAMAGSVVKYSTGSAWLELMDDIYERPSPKFSSGFPPYELTIRMMHRNAKEFGYDCLIGADAMLDPITTLSMMRGVENLCIDLIEDPDTVAKWLGWLSEMRFHIADGYRETRRQLGRKEDFNWCGMWAPGEMDFIECDFSTMLSPQMFNKFAMPEVEKEASFYDYVGWHLDGTAEIRHLDAICSVKNMKAIQWVSDTFTSQLDHIELFKRIRKLGKSILMCCSSVIEAVEITRQIGKDGLAFDLSEAVKTEKDMEYAIKALKGL